LVSLLFGQVRLQSNLAVLTGVGEGMKLRVSVPLTNMTAH